MSELLLLINSCYFMPFFFIDISLHSQIPKSVTQIESAAIDGPTACRYEAPKVNKDRSPEEPLHGCERRGLRCLLKQYAISSDKS